MSCFRESSFLLTYVHLFDLGQAISILVHTRKLATARRHIINILPTVIAKGILRVVNIAVLKSLITIHTRLYEMHVDYLLLRSMHFIVTAQTIGESRAVIVTAL